MSKKTRPTIQLGLFILSIFLGTFVFSGRANATGSDSSTFLLNPSTVLTTTQWPSSYDNIALLPRNVYWNFNTNPFGASGCGTNCNPDATYYGVKDSTLKSGDSFENTNSVTWSGASSEQIGITNSGFFSPAKTGTAVYSFNTSTLSTSLDSNTIYIWAEINVTTSGTGSFVSFSGLTGTNSTVEASELFNESTKKEVGTSALNNDMTTGIYDAYFKVLDPNSTEALTLSFSAADSGFGGTTTALVNSLHIAVTPEPMAMALFATGCAVLFFFRRRRFAFQRA